MEIKKAKLQYLLNPVILKNHNPKKAIGKMICIKYDSNGYPIFFYKKFKGNKIKVLCTIDKLQEVKENPNSKLIEYDTETTHVVGYELYGVLYIQDLIQL